MNPHALQNPLPFPKVVAPSIDGLTLSVPAPQEPTTNDVAARFEELRRERASVTEKKQGDMIGPYDEVCVDLLGYCEGKLVPRSAQFDAWLRIDQPLTYPELAAALKLANVGDGLKVNLTLPNTFITPALRGKPAVYLVDVKQGRQLKLPKVDDPTFLNHLAGAKTYDEAVINVAKELGAQYALKATWRALEVAIDEVSKRADLTLAPNLLQQEVWNAWRETEGKALSEKGLVGQEQADSFESWRDDPVIVDDVARRLRNTIVVNAIAEAHAAELTPERLAECAQRWVLFLGVPAEELEAFKTADVAAKRLTGTVLLELAAAELVLERSKLHFVKE